MEVNFNKGMVPFNSAGCTGISLVKTIKRIDRLRFREQIEVLPTKYALATATNLVVEVARIAPNYFLIPFVNGDSFGGIRLSWVGRSNDHQLCLVLAPDEATKAYFYYEHDQTDQLNLNVSARVLSQYLELLCEDNYQRREKLGDIIRAGIVSS